jgi:hypothetical protein
LASSLTWYWAKIEVKLMTKNKHRNWCVFIVKSPVTNWVLTIEYYVISQEIIDAKHKQIFILWAVNSMGLLKMSHCAYVQFKILFNRGIFKICCIYSMNDIVHPVHSVTDSIAPFLSGGRDPYNYFFIHDPSTKPNICLPPPPHQYFYCEKCLNKKCMSLNQQTIF